MHTDEPQVPLAIYYTVLDVMDEGATTHPRDGWLDRPTLEHVMHARDHLDALLNSTGNDHEDHLTHALTRCAMALTIREGWRQ